MYCFLSAYSLGISLTNLSKCMCCCVEWPHQMAAFALLDLLKEIPIYGLCLYGVLSHLLSILYLSNFLPFFVFDHGNISRH